MRRQQPPLRVQRVCPVCHGTGVDKTRKRRYTGGGHDDRRCPRCDGAGTLNTDPDAPTDPARAAAHQDREAQKD